MAALRRSGAALVFFAFGVDASTALADPYHPTDEEKAAARPVALEGLELASKGDCPGAVEKLARAESLVHAPTIAVPLAECEIKLGKVVLGLALLDRVIAEPLTANSPQPWFEAKQYARQVRDAARARVGKLRIHLEVAPGTAETPIVTLDGQPVPAAVLDTDAPADPGPHHVVARQGALRAETDVTLADGQSATASLNLLGPNGAPAPPGAAQQAPPPAPPQQGYGQPYPSQPPTQGYGPPQTYPPQTSARSAPSGPSPSSDDSGELRGFEFGARFAFGLPFGQLAGGTGSTDLSGYLSNFVAPVWLEAGYRFLPYLDAEGYFMFAIASIGDTYKSAGCGQLSCSQNVTRMGVEAHFHAIPNGPWDPWFGLGVGYEWVGGSVSDSTGTFGLGQSGVEFVNLQAGVDFKPPLRGLGLGPFVTFAVGQYTDITFPNAMGGVVSESIQAQALHEWLIVGVRGDYVLKL